MNISRKRHGFRLLASALLALTLNPAFAEEVQPQAEQGPLPLKELRTFTEVYDRIKKAYVEPVDDATLLNNAIDGMLNGLDPHSVYLRKDALDELQESTRGEFGGLGIEIEMQNGFVRVITPIDDTPALKAGVEAGDLIIKIDDQTVSGLSLQEAVDLMRGKPGTKVTLTVAREPQPQPVEITIVRDIIKVASVKSRSLEPGYGYIRLTQFQVKTGADTLKAIKKLQQENQPLKGLVLDLRNNPGGVLNGAVEVADAFLTKGLIVYTSGRRPNSELRFNATPEDPSQNVPLVVLINGGSASASEIVAGALQDHHRAVILGTESFGKGSVQTVLPLTDESALKLTTARYYTPSGRSIQAEGITPDLFVETTRVTTNSDPALRIKEADLKGHLSNGNEQAREEISHDEIALAERDFQLYEALNLLKGLHIINKSSAITAD
ncbi:MAG: S41 family peptidase [Pseudomonadales bacterium]